jgi:hypothetical protein
MGAGLSEAMKIAWYGTSEEQAEYVTQSIDRDVAALEARVRKYAADIAKLHELAERDVRAGNVTAAKGRAVQIRDLERAQAQSQRRARALRDIRLRTEDASDVAVQRRRFREMAEMTRNLASSESDVRETAELRVDFEESGRLIERLDDVTNVSEDRTTDADAEKETDAILSRIMASVSSSSSAAATERSQRLAERSAPS